MLVPITLVDMVTLFVDGLVFGLGLFIASGVLSWLGGVAASAAARRNP